MPVNKYLVELIGTFIFVATIGFTVVKRMSATAECVASSEPPTMAESVLSRSSASSVLAQ